MIRQHPPSQPPTRTYSHGFTLVELSIVLVILGLLTGGILAGQDLIRAAELRSVTTEHQEFQSAVNTFRNKYMALPGDMDNAERFWGTASACPGTPPVTPAEETCNGNGNGAISDLSGSSDGYEQFRFWQQLANADLINGSYTGVSGPNDLARYDDAVVGENVPASAFGNAGWSLWVVHGMDSAMHQRAWGVNNTTWFEGSYGNWPLVFGNENTAEETKEPALTPEEAWNIDSKADDGKPGTGFIRTAEGGGMNNSCHDKEPGPIPASNAEYLLDNEAVACHLIFIN